MPHAELTTITRRWWKDAEGKPVCHQYEDPGIAASNPLKIKAALPLLESRFGGVLTSPSDHLKPGNGNG